MSKQCSSCMYLDYKNSQGTIFVTYFCGKIQRYVGANTTACGAFMERTTSCSCYLTTACVNYRGLEDDCKELTTLRRFRDEYVAKKENGKELIDKYYHTAPQIVEAINKRDDKEQIYSEIYDYILKCVNHIEQNDNEETLALYTKMVEDMANKYL